jgi:hypothetical protein
MASLLFAIGFTILALPIFASILIILYHGYANRMARHGLSCSNQNARGRGNRIINPSNTLRTSVQANAGNLTSELDHPLPLYVSPTNSNQGGVDLHANNLEVIMIEENLPNNSEVDRLLAYEK